MGCKHERNTCLSEGILQQAAVNSDQCVTFKLGQKALAVAPLQLKDVETDEILQVHQDNHQGVELIRQPEVCKLHPVERCGEHTELETEKSGRRECEKS